MIGLSFKAWRRFTAKRQPKVTTDWLRRVQRNATRIFRNGMLRGPHTGRIYARRGGRRHQASAPGEFPAKDTGRLVASLKGRSNPREATVGTNMHYAKYLREGTRMMARRKMSDNAMQEGRRESGSPRGWVDWHRRKGQ